jgi:hypothetical protein
MGGVDATALRLVNAVLGTLVALVAFCVAREVAGDRTAFVAGLAAALWPSLAFWSATILRDTLVSLTVLALWWVLIVAERQRRLWLASFVTLDLFLLSTLRPYLAQVAAVAVLAWLAYPSLARLPRRVTVTALVGVVAVGCVMVLRQPRIVDDFGHNVMYRQTVTRMETLGRLYRDPRRIDEVELRPFFPGAAVVDPDSPSDWLKVGVVYETGDKPGYLLVAFTDESLRPMLASDLMWLRDAPIPPLQLLSWIAPAVGAVFAGLPDTRATNLAWVIDALAWDTVLAVALIGIIRRRLPMRTWLLPAVVVLATMGSLVALPGSPGNAARHRATHTLPLLLVFASGALTLWGRAVTSASNTPISVTAAAVSVSRSAR